MLTDHSDLCERFGSSLPRWGEGGLLQASHEDYSHYIFVIPNNRKADDEVVAPSA